MKRIITTFIIACFTLPSFASTMPDADITQKIGIGTGPSVSIDFKLNPKTSLGFSLGSPFYKGLFVTGNYDLRLLYKFIDQNKFALSGLIGLAGDQPFVQNRDGSPFGIEAGIAMSYQFSSQFSGRLNVVGGLPLFRYGNFGTFGFYNYLAPASGIELGYKFNKNIEGTIGVNGQGDVLGLNIMF
jgi:hypothetical protein